MKTRMKFVKIVLLSMILLSVSGSADAFKGGRIFNNALTGCPMLLADLAATHSKKDWARVVQEGRLQETIRAVCPKAELKPIPEKNMKDVLEFLQYYSQDGGALPSC